MSINYRLLKFLLRSTKTFPMIIIQPPYELDLYLLLSSSLKLVAVESTGNINGAQMYQIYLIHSLYIFMEGGS